MTVFVDDVRHKFGRMVMCHMWADTLDELLVMADRIGVARKWLQKPPFASWVHFDVSLEKKRQALALGALLTDKFGPVEHEARQAGNQEMLAFVRSARERHGLPADGIIRRPQEALI